MAEAEGGDPVFCAAVPLGGYCAMEGEDATDDEANVPDNPRAFNNAAWWRKLVILFAGAFTNILVAIVTMIITVTIIGMPVNTLSKVSPDGQQLRLACGRVTRSYQCKVKMFTAGLIP